MSTSTWTQVSITSTAGIIIASTTLRVQLILKNIGSYTVYLGKTSGVVDTADNAAGGYPILAGETLYLHDTSSDWYGICSAGQTSTIALYQEEI